MPSFINLAIVDLSLSGIYASIPAEWLIRGSFSGEAAAGNDHLGWALATGNFDCQYGDDLAIGVPDADAAATNMGKVYTTYSNAYGLTKENYGAFIQSELENGGTSEANDRFGFSLAVGNFNTDEYADLVIGVPYEGQDYPVVIDAGAIDIVWGSKAGLSGLDTKYLHQGLAAIADTAEADDRFGEVLAAVPSMWGKTFIPVVKR